MRHGAIAMRSPRWLQRIAHSFAPSQCRAATDVRPCFRRGDRDQRVFELRPGFHLDENDRTSTPSDDVDFSPRTT
jgi:hypothetical protein